MFIYRNPELVENLENFKILGEEDAETFQNEILNLFPERFEKELRRLSTFKTLQEMRRMRSHFNKRISSLEAEIKAREKEEKEKKEEFKETYYSLFSADRNTPSKIIYELKGGDRIVQLPLNLSNKFTNENGKVFVKVFECQYLGIREGSI